MYVLYNPSAAPGMLSNSGGTGGTCWHSEQDSAWPIAAEFRKATFRIKCSRLFGEWFLFLSPVWTKTQLKNHISSSKITSILAKQTKIYFCLTSCITLLLLVEMLNLQQFIFLITNILEEYEKYVLLSPSCNSSVNLTEICSDFPLPHSAFVCWLLSSSLPLKKGEDLTESMSQLLWRQCDSSGAKAERGASNAL